ncbi:hypothetical protein [Pedobacter nyackensis]|uniref:hypothetical protein n=1 Tax=Pedobacter nyackensis TaxID=475255 RepID=UPI00292D26A4|nr:hypothetical protein [Pedobacter nyackensis]
MTKKQILIVAIIIIVTSLISFWFGMYVVINDVGGKEVKFKESIKVEAPKIDTLNKR